jgi:uncharacterized membrane protein YhaH (DUF805 family)
MGDVDLAYLLFSFQGRINRAKFWLGLVLLWAASAILSAILLATRDSAFLQIVLGLISLALIWPGLAISIKRWHDRDKSGWWVLIALIPIIGAIWALVETGFLPGTPGPNQYGPDPLGATQAG